MDELPELPFEKVLSYLNLEDFLKSRAVSRRWYHKINSFKVKTLFYSRHPKDFIYEKNRFVSDAFSRNFIVSTQFESFFKTFAQTILSHLKHLRLYGLDLNTDNRMAALNRALNSFVQLEELDLLYFYFNRSDNYQIPPQERQLEPNLPIPEKRRVLKLNPAVFQKRELKLNLPMLKRIQLKRVKSIYILNLSAPMLKKVQIYDCGRLLKVDLFYGESVEWLFTSLMSSIRVQELRNLKTIYTPGVHDFRLLFGLNHLKAIHLSIYDDFNKLFDLKQRHGRADLQIYCFGCLLDGPDDPAAHLSFQYFLDGKNFLYLPANHSRLADEIPFWPHLDYMTIEHLAPEIQVTILDRLTDLDGLCIDRSVQDIERFLGFLKIFSQKPQFENLLFLNVQLQTLFDRLPEHCNVQKLTLHSAHLDIEFLFRMKNLIELELFHPIGTGLIRRALKELEFLQVLLLNYNCDNYSKYNRFKDSVWSVRKSVESPKRFEVYFALIKIMDTCDLNAVMHFIEEKIIPKLELRMNG